MNLALDTTRYNVSGPSLDTMDTYLTSRLQWLQVEFGAMLGHEVGS